MSGIVPAGDLMSADAAVARMPECVACNQGVDENDDSTPYCIIDGEYCHAKCCEECKDGLPTETTLEQKLQRSIELASEPVSRGVHNPESEVQLLGEPFTTFR